MTNQARLQRLIDQQARDDAGQFNHSSTREVAATDLGDRDQGWAILNGAESMPHGGGGRDWRPPERPDDLGATIYLEGCRGWEAWEDLEQQQPEAFEARLQALEERGGATSIPIACPVCRGKPGGWDRYCLRCDRSGKDGKVRFKGRPVGEVIRRDYLPPDDGLKGGVG